MPTLNWDCGVISCLFWECQIIWIHEGAKKAPGSSILRHKKQQSGFFFFFLVLWYWPALKAAVAFSWCEVWWYTVSKAVWVTLWLWITVAFPLESPDQIGTLFWVGFYFSVYFSSSVTSFWIPNALLFLLPHSIHSFVGLPLLFSHGPLDILLSCHPTLDVPKLFNIRKLLHSKKSQEIQRKLILWYSCFPCNYS